MQLDRLLHEHRCSATRTGARYTTCTASRAWMQGWRWCPMHEGPASENSGSSFSAERCSHCAPPSTMDACKAASMLGLHGSSGLISSPLHAPCHEPLGLIQTSAGMWLEPAGLCACCHWLLPDFTPAAAAAQECSRLAQAAQAAEGEVQHRGRYVVRIDTTEALHPYDLSVAVAPEIASVAMENVLHIPVMDDTTAIVGCAPLVRTSAGTPAIPDLISSRMLSADSGQS